MHTSAAALAPSPVSPPFESRWCWSWCLRKQWRSSASGTNSFLGALVVSRVLGRQDSFSCCVAVPWWSRSRHGVQGRWPAADRETERRDVDETQRRQADQLTPHTSQGVGVQSTGPPLPPARQHGERERAPAVTSSATRRVKHAHHKTSRRRRGSGEDLGHPADERCGGLA